MQSAILLAISSALAPAGTASSAPAATAAAASRRWDYSVVAQGQPFVAPSWLDDELLQALRADLRSLLDAESVPDVDEPIGKRFKLELDTKDWSAPGEAAPSEARAAMRRRLDELRVELEEAVGRPLLLDALGSQVKYTASKPGEPVSARPCSNTRARVLDRDPGPWRSDRDPGPPARARQIHLHLDSRHEAFAWRYYGQEKTRRSLAWLLYLSDDGWDEPGGSGSGGALRTYP